MGMIDLGEEMEKEFEVALINVDILTQNTKNLLDHIANKYFVNSKKTNDGSGFKTSSNPLDVVKLCWNSYWSTILNDMIFGIFI